MRQYTWDVQLDRKVFLTIMYMYEILIQEGKGLYLWKIQ